MCVSDFQVTKSMGTAAPYLNKHGRACIGPVYSLGLRFVFAKLLHMNRQDCILIETYSKLWEKDRQLTVECAYLRYSSTACKRMLALMVGFLVVEPAHPGSSSRFGMGICIFLNLF
jgi:hypothetical protein